MRQNIKSQLSFGNSSIEKMQIDLKSRDDIPALLIGLKYIYMNPELREKILAVLKRSISEAVSLNHGRPGMDLWRILVLGIIRLGAGLDYDRLHELANQHSNIRVMLIVDTWDQEFWTLEAIQDNVRFLTPEVLDQINLLVVQAGHKLLKKKSEESPQLNGRCDSFVVETDVHFPTDISLLYDAIRKILKFMARIPSSETGEGWRQWKYLLKKVKKLVRKIGKIRQSINNSKKGKCKTKEGEERKALQQKKLVEEFAGLHQELLRICEGIIHRAEKDLKNSANIGKIQYFIQHAKRQMNQINRRVLNGESIPQEEKVYSIFEPHTEWISKGKAGVPQELGLRVCVIEDQHGFILNHKVMEKQTDDQVVVEIIQDTKNKFPNFNSCSFDKAFHSPSNKIDLSEILDTVILPKKGKLSVSQLEEESSDDFVSARHQHSAVESAINSLEHHGLDRCLDLGLAGFKRYVSLAILGKNIYQLGRIILEQEKLIKAKKFKPHLIAA
ncbi:MAG: ISNCY family transposase [Thermoproteota archaeon]